MELSGRFIGLRGSVVLYCQVCVKFDPHKPTMYDYVPHSERSSPHAVGLCSATKAFEFTFVVAF